MLTTCKNMNQTFVRWTARPRRKNKIEPYYQPATLHSIMSTVDTERERDSQEALITS